MKINNPNIGSIVYLLETCDTYSDYKKCDGGLLAIAQHPELFNIVGYTFSKHLYIESTALSDKLKKKLTGKTRYIKNNLADLREYFRLPDLREGTTHD